MSILKPLVWTDESDVDIKHTAKSALHEYEVQHHEVGGKYELKYTPRDLSEPAKFRTGFSTIEQAKVSAFEHYNEKMESYLSDNTIDGYFTKFTKWARDRKIIQNGSILAQGLKLVSEVGELADNLAKGRCIKDDIGDCMVVLNNLAHMSGLTLEECLEQAWNDIKDRKGTMNEHGVFIKEGDNG